LKDEEALQGYFTRRMDEFLTSHGRRLIGWTRSSRVVGAECGRHVLARRGRRHRGGQAGHDVVMTPGHIPTSIIISRPTLPRAARIGGFLPLDTVYAFEPVRPP